MIVANDVIRIGKIARPLREHRELILNHFRAQKLLSSGVVEGLNNKTKVTMRKSYGFRTFRCLELALHHSLGKLSEPESTTISSDESYYRNAAIILLYHARWHRMRILRFDRHSDHRIR
jgi:Transposase